MVVNNSLLMRRFNGANFTTLCVPHFLFNTHKFATIKSAKGFLSCGLATILFNKRRHHLSV